MLGAKTISMAALVLALLASQAQAAERWIGTWAAPPAPPQTAGPNIDARRVSPSFEDQTLVQTVRISAGGPRLRLRLTNEYGKAPLSVGAARVSLVSAEGRSGSPVAVTFGGRPAAVIPAGAPLLSDPVDLPTGALATLRIALYLPGKTGLCTCHFAGAQAIEVSPAGDYTARPFSPAATGPTAPAYRAFLSGVEVERAGAGPVIVAFGDSITDGTASTAGANRRWPDRLAERLMARRGRAAVVNSGIAGNRVLSDGAIPIFGESALTRFDRDVLAVPGATHLVVLEGVNDLGGGAANPPSAEQIIAGYQQLIARAHEHGVKVILATILPYEGARYFHANGEAVRQQVNAWIRAGRGFDGVVDFDAAIRDPAHTTKMRADLQSGDWLHPNDAGYRVMGDAVDLALFR